jgi:hypothetical protein
VDPDRADNAGIVHLARFRVGYTEAERRRFGRAQDIEQGDEVSRSGELQPALCAAAGEDEPFFRQATRHLPQKFVRHPLRFGYLGSRQRAAGVSGKFKHQSHRVISPLGQDEHDKCDHSPLNHCEILRIHLLSGRGNIRL